MSKCRLQKIYKKTKEGFLLSSSMVPFLEWTKNTALFIITVEPSFNCTCISSRMLSNSRCESFAVSTVLMTRNNPGGECWDCGNIHSILHYPVSCEQHMHAHLLWTIYIIGMLRYSQHQALGSPMLACSFVNIHQKCLPAMIPMPCSPRCGTSCGFFTNQVHFSKGSTAKFIDVIVTSSGRMC